MYRPRSAARLRQARPAFVCLPMTLFLLTLPILALPARAERIVDLLGFVTDPAGAPIEQARVRLLGTTFGVLTEANGLFQIDRVPPGNYTMHVSAPDHLPWSGSLSVPLDDLAGLEIALVPAATIRDGWAETYFDAQRFGSDAIQYVPARLRSPGPAAGERFAARASIQSNGRFDPEVGAEAFHLGALELGGRSSNEVLHYFLATSGLSSEAVPQERGVLPNSPFGFFPIWTRDTESGNLRARLQVLPGNSYSLTADLDYSRASGRAYAHMWSRPGFVQTFRDTLQQTGEIVLRRGRYSPTQIDESYQWFDPRDHLPTEEAKSLSLRAVFDQQFSENLSYVAHASYERLTFDSRVGNKNAWEYEGERQADYWFNYADRESEEFFVIANDFPRLAEGELSGYSGGVDFQYGDDSMPLDLGFEAGYRDLRFFEVLLPYATDSNGEIGAAKSRYRGYHPSLSGYARKSWQLEELRLTAGMGYETFHLLEGLPIEPAREDLEHQLTPHVELRYPLSPRIEFSFQGERTVRRPSAEHPREYARAVQERVGVYLAVPDLVPESAVVFRTALALTQPMAYGKPQRTRAELAFYYEDISDPFTTRSLTVFGGVSPQAHLANGRPTEAKGVQLQVSRSFDDRIGGAVRYTFGEIEMPEFFGSGTIPAVEDVRHRLELSVDLGRPGAIWTSTRLNFESGRPYTPDYLDWLVREDENSERLPATATVDIDVERELALWGQRFSLFFQGRNVLDTQNIVDLDPLNWPGPPRAIGNEYMIYYTETGWTGGAYLTDVGPAENSGEWVPVGDPRVLGAPRDLRFGLAVSF